MQKLITLFAILLISGSALAVSTSHWTHTSEADFKAGTFDNVVATNLGDLKLSRAVHTLLEQDARVSAVYALAEAPDGSIFAGTGPQGVLLKINGEKVETAATLGENLNLFSLALDSQNRLLIGTGGAKGSIYRIEKPGDKPTEIFTDTKAQYIWAMIATPDGNVYAATGPNGKLFEIHPDGSNKILFETDENNLLSMVSDGKDLLYVGTDPNGHLYRINRKTGESFVLFDAPESEISALAIDAAGNVYAGTGESQGEQTPDTAPAAEQGGRPETEQNGSIPIPSEPPKAPAPPKLPLPGPSDPQPIPKNRPAINSSSQPLHMMIAPNDSDGDTMKPQQDEPPDNGPDNPPDQPPGQPVPAPRRKKPARPPLAAAAEAAQNSAQGTVSDKKAGQPPATGNAIYKIDPAGFVTEVLRQDVLFLSIYEHNGELLVGTGSDGAIDQVNPAAEENSVIAEVDPKEVLCLLPTKDGKIFVGMANDGQIATLSSGFASKGTFTSPVLDAQQISRFGKIQLRGALPKGTSLKLATRSGNIGETADRGWSKWSDDVAANEFSPITSPAARFFQYRLTFESSDTAHTPVVDEVNVAYQMPNLAPQIKSIKLSAAGGGGGVGEKSDQAAPAADAPAHANPNVTISWEATDPNDDALQYNLYFRRLDDEFRGWVLLKEKLTDATFDWNTRGVGDGRYEVKVVASDAFANPIGEGRSASRVSDPIDVDNSPPVVGEIATTAGDAKVQVKATVVDQMSTVAMLEYAVDSSTDWQAVLPVDKIADSPEESYDFAVSGLSGGGHQITLRATDSHGNQAFESVTVTIAKPKDSDKSD